MTCVHLQWSRPETNVSSQLTWSLHGNLCYGGPLRGSVVPAKFLFVSLYMLPVEHETSNALVVVWSGERSTLRITDRDTAQTERILMRLVDISRQPSASVKQKECLHVIHDLSLSHLVVFASVARTTRCSF